MGYYGRKSNTRPRLTGRLCEVCGETPEMRWHKHHDHSLLSIEKHSQNRIKIEAYYANHPNVNRPDLANKRLCPDCAETLVFQPMNR